MLCSSLTRWIVKKDKKELIDFYALNSAYAQDYFTDHRLPFDKDTILFVKDEKVFKKSVAVYEILLTIDFCTFCVRMLRLMPLWFSDSLYDVVAKMRRWVKIPLVHL